MTTTHRIGELFEIVLTGATGLASGCVVIAVIAECLGFLA